MGIKGTVTLADKNEIRPEIKSIKMKVTSKILSTLLFQSGEHNFIKISTENRLFSTLSGTKSVFSYGYLRIQYSAKN